MEFVSQFVSLTDTLGACGGVNVTCSQMHILLNILTNGTVSVVVV